MRITPLDVRKQEFRKAVRGYDADEVRGFLTTLAEEYEAVLVDNKTLREAIGKQEEKLKDYQQLETTLRDTLMTAQRVMADTKANAKQEAGLIVQEARQKAEAIMAECRARTEELRRDILMLRKEKETYLARFRSLAQAQLQFVDSHEQDFAGLDQRLLEMADAAVGTMTMPTDTPSWQPAAPSVATPAAQSAVPPASAMPAAPATTAPAASPAAQDHGSGSGEAGHDQWRDYAPRTTATASTSASAATGPTTTAPSVTPGTQAPDTAATPSAPASSTVDSVLAEAPVSTGAENMVAGAEASPEQVASSLAEAVELASMGIPVAPHRSGGDKEPVGGSPAGIDVTAPV